MSYNKRQLMSLDDFRCEVMRHVFSFQLAKSAEPLDPHMLERFVRAQDYEANVLFPTAWAGGDPYMQILAKAGHEHAKRLMAPTNAEKLANSLLDALHPEFREYLALLAKHDWYYSYSDDRNVWRTYHEAQMKLNAFRTRGELWEKAYVLAAPK